MEAILRLYEYSKLLDQEILVGDAIASSTLIEKRPKDSDRKVMVFET